MTLHVCVSAPDAPGSSSTAAVGWDDAGATCAPAATAPKWRRSAAPEIELPSPAMSRIARNPAKLAEYMIELMSRARRLGRERAPIVGGDRTMQRHST